MELHRDTYRFMLQDRRWEAKRMRIFIRDVSCQLCGSEKLLHAHHVRYSGKHPWDCADSDLIALCPRCHAALHKIIDNPTRYSAKLSGTGGVLAAIGCAVVGLVAVVVVVVVSGSLFLWLNP